MECHDFRVRLSSLLLFTTALGCGAPASDTESGSAGAGETEGETDASPASGGASDPMPGLPGDETGGEGADETGGGNDTDPQDSTGGTEEPPPRACTFSEEPLEWSLPELTSLDDVYEQTSDVHACSVGTEFRYQLLDMTGDGALDFLVTDQCDAQGIGTTHWEVYENTGAGFDD